MDVKLRAGQRLKVVREMLGFTIPAFAEAFDIDKVRLKNIEQQRARVSEEEFFKIGSVMPELLRWLVLEGPISIKEINKSDNAYMKMIASRLEAGIYPKSFDVTEKIEE